MRSYVFVVNWKKAVHIFLYTLAFNTLIAVLLTVLGFGRGFVVNFIISQCIGLTNCSLILVGFYFLKPVKKTGQVLLILSALSVGSVAGFVIGLLVSGMPPAVVMSNLRFIWKVFFISVFFGVIISYFFTAQDRMTQSRTMIDAERIKRLSSEKQTAEMELKMLQAQIEPHFLYNTLFNIHSLLDVDLKSGKAMLGNLYRFLRTALSRTRTENSTIAQEIELIQAYLAIFQNRMNERLRYRIELPETLAQTPFPPMLLQPLVENAIKHGLEPSVQGGEILIRVQQHKERIQVCVVDTGVGFSGLQSSGVGLMNIQERLKALYGEAGRLVVRDNHPTGVNAMIEVPYV